MKLENGDRVSFWSGSNQDGMFYELSISTGNESIFSQQYSKGSVDFLIRALAIVGVSKKVKSLNGIGTSEEERELVKNAICKMFNYRTEIKCDDNKLKLTFTANRYEPIIKKYQKSQVRKLLNDEVRVTLEGDDCVDNYLNNLVTLEKEKTEPETSF